MRIKGVGITPFGGQGRAVLDIIERELAIQRRSRLAAGDEHFTVNFGVAKHVGAVGARQIAGIDFRLGDQRFIFLHWIEGVTVIRADAQKAREWTGRLTGRSEEHTSELQSLMRISYAVFCLKKKK